MSRHAPQVVDGVEMPVKASLGMKIVQYSANSPPVISDIYPNQPAALTVRLHSLPTARMGCCSSARAAEIAWGTHAASGGGGGAPGCDRRRPILLPHGTASRRV